MVPCDVVEIVGDIVEIDVVMVGAVVGATVVTAVGDDTNIEKEIVGCCTPEYGKKFILINR